MKLIFDTKRFKTIGIFVIEQEIQHSNQLPNLGIYLPLYKVIRYVLEVSWWNANETNLLTFYQLLFKLGFLFILRLSIYDISKLFFLNFN